eukprot:gnl/TRDRNA2_/TRDRNA2_80540_c0_seq1.p1 gnl/TRDRNA2_/TRDRNA2_80540_c0~~gnl/TRDRNA2_/TRDRNA2_80540_c0_seq1.p1  ORF type:complete len:531 (-),score=89.81 gnl/TRDRNA2_/TRDRNA2_80540_c0_seq1:84-1676(-)
MVQSSFHWCHAGLAVTAYFLVTPSDAAHLSRRGAKISGNVVSDQEKSGDKEKEKWSAFIVEEKLNHEAEEKSHNRLGALRAKVQNKVEMVSLDHSQQEQLAAGTRDESNGTLTVLSALESTLRGFVGIQASRSGADVSIAEQKKAAELSSVGLIVFAVLIFGILVGCMWSKTDIGPPDSKSSVPSSSASLTSRSPTSKACTPEKPRQKQSLGAGRRFQTTAATAVTYGAPVHERSSSRNGGLRSSQRAPMQEVEESATGSRSLDAYGYDSAGSMPGTPVDSARSLGGGPDAECILGSSCRYHVGGLLPQTNLRPGVAAFCPSLIVPESSECVLVVPLHGPGSYDVTDENGNMVLRVISQMAKENKAMSTPPGSRRQQPKAAASSSGSLSPRVFRSLVLTSASGSVLASCCTAPGASMRGVAEFHLLSATGEYYAKLVRGEAQDTFVLDTVGGVRLHFWGWFEDHAVNISDEEGSLLATTEACTGDMDRASSDMSDEAGPHYKLRVTPLTDVGLVLCGLLCLDHLVEDHAA